MLIGCCLGLVIRCCDPISRSRLFFSGKKANLLRTTPAEIRAKNALMEDQIADLRQAAECHRQTRQWVQSWIKPGMLMTDICQRLEDKNRELIG